MLTYKFIYYIYFNIMKPKKSIYKKKIKKYKNIKINNNKIT